MGSRVECFWMDPIEWARESLRRYAGKDSCPSPWGYCNASVLLEGEVPYPFAHQFPDIKGCLFGEDRTGIAHDDTRWPSRCASCGRPFDEGANWQQHVSRLFVGGGHRCLLEDMPVGAMYDSSWWPETTADGIVLSVVCPPGGRANHWMVDGPSKSGGRWTREGVIPKVTARPSILIGSSGYHGFLTDGFLVEC